MKKVIALLLLLLFSSPFLLGNEKIQVWPRQDTVVWPTNIKMFVVFELPVPADKGSAQLVVTLPDNVNVIGIPDGAPPTMPPLSILLRPTKFSQNGNVATFDFAKDSTFNRKELRVPIAISVNAAPGNSEMMVKFLLDNKVIANEKFPVKIYPELKGLRPEKLEIAAYDYHGLDKFSRPIFCEMLQKSGVQELHHMRGDSSTEESVSDIALQYNMKNGLVFFTHHIQEFFKNRSLKSGKTFSSESHAQLLDNPEIFKAMILEFFQEKFSNKQYSIVIFDAESGGVRDGKIVNDTSEFAFTAFRRYMKLNKNAPLNVDIIGEKYKSDWALFVCEQNNRTARLIREVIDEHYPNIRFQAYSGYQYDSGAHKDYTRTRYGTDWALMSETGIDVAVAGYHGAPALLKYTTTVVEKKVPFYPAEMYVENYLTKKIAKRTPEMWSMRLIQAYLSGSRLGITLWYANIFDGTALVAIDKLSDFMARVEPMVLNGNEDREMIDIMPKTQEHNVTIFRNGGEWLVVAVNNSPKAVRIRLNLKMRLTGFTGGLNISDAVSGQKIKAAKTIPLEIRPYSYRMLTLLDDGN